MSPCCWIRAARSRFAEMPAWWPAVLAATVGIDNVVSRHSVRTSDSRAWPITPAWRDNPTTFDVFDASIHRPFIAREAPFRWLDARSPRLGVRPHQHGGEGSRASPPLLLLTLLHSAPCSSIWKHQRNERRCPHEASRRSRLLPLARWPGGRTAAAHPCRRSRRRPPSVLNSFLTMNPR
jgi:hypothetical protein